MSPSTRSAPSGPAAPAPRPVRPAWFGDLPMTRGRLLASLAVVGVAGLMTLVGCCCDPKKGKCIKDPPCRPCENPCCLTPVQKVALEGKTHALPQPIAYLYEKKKILILTEKGKEDWDKDPQAFVEKGVRAVKPGGTIYMDINPGFDVDVVAMTRSATPYQKP